MNSLVRALVAFQAFWHGPPLGATRSACLNSFLQKGHELNLYLYKDFDDIPPGVVIQDANSIIPEEHIVYFAGADGRTFDLGPFSDLFRFKLLKERGGWWTDVDVICLSSEIPAVENAWTLEAPTVKPGYIGTSQLCIAQGSHLANTLYSRCEERSKLEIKDRTSLGPDLLTQVIRELNLPEVMNAEPATFYPLWWIEMFKLWLPEFFDDVVEATTGSYFLPIFQSFPTWIGLDMQAGPPPDSYLGRFLKQNSLRLSNLVHYKSEIVREHVRSYFLANSEWTLKPLRDLCTSKELAMLDIGEDRWE